MGSKYLLMLLAVIAAGALVGWARGRSHDPANAARGRARAEWAAWALALGVLTVAVLVTGRLQATLQGNSRGWALLIFAVVVALALALRPGLAYRIVPVLLIVLGLAGFLLARNNMLTWFGQIGFPFSSSAAPVAKGVTTAPAVAPAYPGTGIVQAPLVLAWVFVLLGGWLVWRSPDPVLSRARLLLGRVNERPRLAQLATLLLLPVAIMVAELSRSPGWASGGGAAVWFALWLAAAVVVIRRWPAAAARLAVAGLLFLGLAGIVLATSNRFGYAPSAYGLVFVASRTTPGLALGQGLVLLASAAWLTPQAFPSVGQVLGLTPDAELTERVQRLTESRAVVVDTASSDLRRLERDLHDGAQARLVAVGMSLRAAERLIPENPDAAIALVAEARETSAKALTELRELVRGVLPPVLADRGLADAVRALALDSPLAVETRIDLPGRVARPVETACYFAVAELLTNAAKHSGARDARVDVSHRDGMLRIVVTDFGLGGADAAAGSGLAGVEKRLAAFDGIMAISSPTGGPTIVVLEVPCALWSPKTSSC